MADICFGKHAFNVLARVTKILVANEGVEQVVRVPVHLGISARTSYYLKDLKAKIREGKEVRLYDKVRSKIA